MNKRSRILIAVTGAGGHLFCGLGVADEIRKKSSDTDIYFAGSRNTLAEESVKKSGYRYFRVISEGLTGKGINCFLKFVFGQFAGILHSLKILLSVKPDVIFSAGGFSSFGFVVWSKILRIPCVIHEQNFIPGKANLLASKFAETVLLSFSGTEKYFKGKKCFYAGMPVRFGKGVPKTEARKELGLDRDIFTVLVMGGSKGARGINKIIFNILDKLPKDIQFIHLTGKDDLAQAKCEYEKRGCKYHIEEFSSRMDVIYSAGDVAICRAGSGTLAEIAFFGLPCVLVPYPYSSDRHQYLNADYFEKNGAAVVMTEEDMSCEKMIDILRTKFNGKIDYMAECSKKLGNPNAGKVIADKLMELVYA